MEAKYKNLLELEFIDNLMEILNLKDAKFRAILYKRSLFYGDSKDKVQGNCTRREAAEIFIKNVVQEGDSNSFEQLMSAMEEFNSPASRSLAKKIRLKASSPAHQPKKRNLSKFDSADESPKKKGKPEPTSGGATGIVEEKYEQDEDGEPLYDEKDLQEMYDDAKCHTTTLTKFENLGMKEREMVTKVQAMIIVVNKFEDRATRCHLKPPDDSDVILDVLCTKHDGPDLSQQSFLIGKFGKCPVAVTKVAQGCGRDAAMHASRDVFPNMQVFIALGVAAGFAENKVRLGDVLISDRIHDCSIVKAKEGETIPRGEVLKAHKHTLNYLEKNHDWKYPCTKDKKRFSTAVFGPILSKSELVDDPKKREQYIEAHCKEAKGFEMEGFSLMGYKNIECIIVKGVCDYAGKKEKKWQPTAALAANDCLLKVLMKNDFSAFFNDQA